jgi:hypothetical protein
MRRARLIQAVLHRRPLRRLGLGLAAVPGIVPLLARLTRLTAPERVATIAGPQVATPS